MKKRALTYLPLLLSSFIFLFPYNYTMAQCNPPLSGYMTTATTATTATLTWDPEPTATNGYEVEYGVLGTYTIGNSSTYTLVTTPTNSITITGLTPSTDYEYNLRSICSGGTMSNLSFTFQRFSTTAACPTPINLLSMNVTATTVDLSWDTVTGAVSYTIQYRETGTTTWMTTTSGTNMLPLTGLNPQTDYEFQVQADCGSGSLSTFSSPPERFMTDILCGIPVNLSVANETTTTADLSWDPVAGAVTYDITYNPVGGSATVIPGVSSPYTLTGLTPGMDYEFDVQADCGGGAVSGFSNTATRFSTLPNCNTPINLVTSNVTSTTADLGWDPVATAISYDVRYREVGTGTWMTMTVSANMLALTGLTPGTDYEFEVQADCSGLMSNFSATQQFSTPCDVPNGLTTNNLTVSTADLSWNPVAGAISYDIQYQETPSGAIMTITGVSSPYTLMNLVANTSYQFFVQANCGSGNSSGYSPASPMFTTLICAVPTGLMANNLMSNSADLSWTAVANAIDYTVEYQAVGAGSWMSTTVSSITTSISGLSPGTDYIFQVEANCGSGNTSGFSSTSPFATICPTPINLVASNETTSSGDLTWDPVPGAVSYDIVYQELPSGSAMTVSTVAPPYTLGSLMAGTNYQYQIQANCGNGSSSSLSVADQFMTLINCAVPTGLTVTNLTTTSADLNWNAVAGAIDYQVQYQVVGSGSWVTSIVTGITTSISGLSSGVDYVFQVEANCGSGNTSGFSGNVPFATTCPVPINLMVSNLTTTNADLTWDVVSGGISYDIIYQELPSGTAMNIPNVTPPYVLTGLMPGTNYQYQVQTNCGNGSTSGLSIVQQFMTVGSCAIPINLVASNIMQNSVDLSWDPVMGATSYNIQYQELPSGTVITIPNATLPYNLMGLVAGTNYQFSVQADCGGGNISPYSSNTTFSTPSACPMPTGLVTTNITTVSADLSWNVVTAAINGYDLRYRAVGSGTWMTISVGTTNYILTSLSPGTTYEFEVQSLCGGGLTSGYTQPSTQFTTLGNSGDIIIGLKVFLEGAYTGASTMTTNLLASNLLPLVNPYSAAPWNYGGGESVSNISDFPANMVDWVYVEARTGTTASSIVESHAAFLLSDGSVVDADGVSPGVRFSGLTGGSAYYFVIRHRNHQDVMSATAIPAGTSVNFTVTGSTLGGDVQMANIGGIFNLRAGDFDANGVINFDDFNGYRLEAGQNNTYIQSDFDLNGDNDANDFTKWQPNAQAVGVLGIRY